MTQERTPREGVVEPTAIGSILRASFDLSPSGLLVFDTDLRYVLVNQQMASMANTPVEKLIGRSVREMFGAYEELTTRVERVLATGEPLIGYDVVGEVPGEDHREHVWSLSVYRLVDTEGTVLGVTVASTEVTAARAIERDRTALAERLQLLAASGELLSGGLDEQATITGVLDLVVPAVARWACLHLQEDDGTVRLAASRHTDPELQGHLDRVLTALAVTLDQPVGAGHVIATGQSEDLPEVTDDMLVALADGDAGLLDGLRSLGVEHGVVVPLTAGGTPFGALTLSVPAEPDPPDSVVTVDGAARTLAARHSLVADLAARASLALENARLYARQHEVAVTLQRSLLPRSLPQLDGWDLGAHYRPGAPGTEVGGDFYEAVRRDDGRLVLAIGDVMGRGIRAAAVMGQVRAALRGFALEGHAPVGILRRLNVMVSAIEDPAIVTCLVAALDPTTGEVELASAGHLSPLRVSDREPCTPLELVPGPPLGVLGAQYESSRARIAPGEGLMAFTDGLVESREQPVDEGIEALRAVIDEALGDGSGEALLPDELCTSAVAGMSRGGATADDIAVLVVRRTRPGAGAGV
jgi:serine phosphatase RsbU (regulator of sigma subunit)